MQRPHTGKVQQAGSTWETSQLPKDGSGAQKPPGMEEFLSKQWVTHANFLHTLKTGRTGLWAGDTSGKGPAVL